MLKQFSFIKTAILVAGMAFLTGNRLHCLQGLDNSIRATYNLDLVRYITYGPSQKKFMTNQLRETLVSLTGQPMLRQGEKLNQVFEEWRGPNPQVDDVILIGIRY